MHYVHVVTDMCIVYPSGVPGYVIKLNFKVHWLIVMGEIDELTCGI